MKNGKYFAFFQQLGKMLMTPVMILPIAGILMGLGAALTSNTVVQAMPFLEHTSVQYILTLLKSVGSIVFNNLPVIFAISIAMGYAKKEKGVAALSAFLAFMVMNVTMNSILTLTGSIDPANLKTGQSVILGVPSLDTGVFGGIILGFIVAFLHNRYYTISLPPILSVFNGTKFVPMVSILTAIIFGFIMSGIWPFFQSGLSSLSDVIKGTGASGTFIYGLSERLLLPFGLHHFVYLPFFFTSLGGSEIIGGKVVEGAVNIFQAQLGMSNPQFDIDVSRFVMNGKILIASFGLPAAALAMYHTAKGNKKQKVKALLIAGCIPAIFMGVTEPIEFTFLFIAPVLYVFHAIMAGIAYLVTYLFEINIPGSTAFGGPFFSFIFNGVLQGNEKTHWVYVPIIGIIYFTVYYFGFRYFILKFNLKTPGRDESDDFTETTAAQETKLTSNEVAAGSAIVYDIIEALGSKENIISVDACWSRLRVKVKDKDKVKDEAYWKKIGANGLVKVNDGVQAIYGAKADIYKTQIREILDLD